VLGVTPPLQKLRGPAGTKRLLWLLLLLLPLPLPLPLLQQSSAQSSCSQALRCCEPWNLLRLSLLLLPLLLLLPKPLRREEESLRLPLRLLLLRLCLL
jgi:hypothetical protein